MKHRVFTIFDDKARCYLPPFTLPEQGMALRTFSDCVNSPDHQFGRHPADYTLFELGFFDDNSGIFTKHDHSLQLANGITMVDRQDVVAQGAALGDPDFPVNGDDPEGSLVSSSLEDM